MSAVCKGWHVQNPHKGEDGKRQKGDTEQKKLIQQMEET